MLIKKPLFFHSTQAKLLLCFKIFIMASYQSVVNINIITKFLIGHKAFVSLCAMFHCVLLSLRHFIRYVNYFLSANKAAGNEIRYIQLEVSGMSFAALVKIGIRVTGTLKDA